MFTLPFLQQADISDFYFRGNIERVSATVEGVDKTGSSSDGVAIHKYKFRLNSGGKDYELASFAPSGRAAIGEIVEAEFPSGQPERARIVGMRAKPFSAWMLLLVLFPLPFTIWAIFSLRNGFRLKQLIQSGITSPGKLLAVRPTSVSINERQLVNLEIEFRTQTGTLQTCRVSTTTPELVEENPNFKVIYNANNPVEATVLDFIPEIARRHLEGKSSGNTKAFALLLFPLLTAAVYWLSFS